MLISSLLFRLCLTCRFKKLCVPEMYQRSSMFTSSLLTKIIIWFLGIGKCLNAGNFLLVFENILGLCIFTNDVSESCIQEELREKKGIGVECKLSNSVFTRLGMAIL
uniref:Uncharacterized protein n=1 Tax=Cacopsylla melanoneura TaxID=428564 RepID=A0A8D8TQZ2_9HEMI